MDETGYVYYRAGLTTAERDKVLHDYAEQLQFVIHRSANQILFPAWQPQTLLPAGQAFGKQVEIRWQPSDHARWDVQLLSESRQPTLETAGWEHAEMDVTDEWSVYLWGEHWASLRGADSTADLPDAWVQAQIEADLHYPVVGSKNKPSVRATVKAYRQEGIVRLTRFTAVKPIEEVQ